MCWAKFQGQRHRIQRWIDKLSRNEKKAEKEARSRGATATEIYNLGNEYFSEYKLAEEEMSQLTSNYYVALAHRLLIPIPEFKTEDGAWVESQIRPGHYYLSPDVLHELRSSVRREVKERRDVFIVWLAAITGLVGALTRLVAMIKH